MSYAVVFTRPAIEDLARIPTPVIDVLRSELDKLAANPVSVSRPAHFPYPQCQMHQFFCIADGDRHVVTILFRYADSRSENVIGLLGIAFQTIGPALDETRVMRRQFQTNPRPDTIPHLCPRSPSTAKRSMRKTGR